LRNFQEHPTKHKKTTIENFKLTPDGKSIVVPQWHITGEEPNAIKEDMDAIVNFLLEIAEAMFIHAVMSAVKKEIPFGIEKITEVNPAAPMQYRLTLDMSKISLSE
jgi:hypothetical protein